jgi:hypothetical protein
MKVEKFVTRGNRALWSLMITRSVKYTGLLIPSRVRHPVYCQAFRFHPGSDTLYIVRPLDSIQGQTPCILSGLQIPSRVRHPVFLITLIWENLACWFPTRPIWNVGFFQPSIMKNDNFHDVSWYFKVFRSIFDNYKVQKNILGVIFKTPKKTTFFVANLGMFTDPP